MNYLLGIDVGTTGIKALLMDAAGRVAASSLQEYPLSTPHPQWAEQDPEDWWQATIRACQAILGSGVCTAKDIQGIGFSGQMHGSVFLDEQGQVVRPCLLWCDNRTGSQCARITQVVGAQRLHELTSNAALAGFTAPKVVWLQENEPENFKRVRTLLLPKDYVRYRLTGVLNSDISDDAGTLLYQVREQRWATELLDILGIPQGWLPPVKGSAEVAGEISAAAAAATGLAVGTPVVAGGADNTCGAVGTGVISEGQILSSLGSSGVIFAPTASPRVDPQERVHTFNHSVPCTWYLMGCMLSAGLSFRWYRDVFASAEQTLAEQSGRDVYDVLTEGAATVAPGAEGLFFLPYLMGERSPHKDPNARGAYVGMTIRHQRPHMVRALLEGITFGLRDSLEIIRGLGVVATQVRATGGGAKSAFWRQLQADVFGVPIVTTSSTEGPAFGAAILAGVGVGVYPSIAAATAQLIKETSQTDPRPEQVKVYNEYYGIFRELYPALKSSFTAITNVVNRRHGT